MSKLRLRFYCNKCQNEWIGELHQVDCCQCDSTGFIIYDVLPVASVPHTTTIRDSRLSGNSNSGGFNPSLM